MCAYECGCLRVYIYIYMCVCVCMYVYTYRHTHTHIYIYTYESPTKLAEDLSSREWTWDVQICVKTFTTDRGPPSSRYPILTHSLESTNLHNR